MRSWKQVGPGVLVVVAVTALGVGCGRDPALSQPTPPEPSATVSRMPVGTASCSARTCHGGVERSAGQRLFRDEYTTWVRNDPHADAYRVLFGARACDIMCRLDDRAAGKPAHQDARCLACHALPVAAEDERLASMRPDGVGCEACHGQAGEWLGPHTTPEWTGQTPCAKACQGMTPVDDLAAVARACVGCHVGAPPDRAQKIPAREVSHELLAAGHPRLAFEFSIYLANLPPHWNPAPRPGRPQPDRTLRMWMVGQLVSAQAALDLLVFRTGAGGWPELAEYDCFACHHELRQPSWRQGPVGSRNRIPGRWTWGSWYFPMLPLVPQGNPADADTLAGLKTLMESPRANATAVGPAAQDAVGLLRKWQARLQSQASEQDLGRALQRWLLPPGPPGVPPSWDLAEQFVLAARVVEQARLARRKGGVPGDPDGQTQAMFRGLFQELALPPGMESPSRFAWDEPVHGRLRDLVQRLGRPEP